MSAKREKKNRHRKRLEDVRTNVCVCVCAWWERPSAVTFTPTYLAYERRRSSRGEEPSWSANPPSRSYSNFGGASGTSVTVYIINHRIGARAHEERTFQDSFERRLAKGRSRKFFFIGRESPRENIHYPRLFVNAVNTLTEEEEEEDGSEVLQRCGCTWHRPDGLRRFSARRHGDARSQSFLQSRLLETFGHGLPSVRTV